MCKFLAPGGEPETQAAGRRHHGPAGAGAAELWGLTHQRPSSTETVTQRDRPEGRLCGRVHTRAERGRESVYGVDSGDPGSRRGKGDTTDKQVKDPGTVEAAAWAQRPSAGRTSSSSQEVSFFLRPSTDRMRPTT